MNTTMRYTLAIMAVATTAAVTGYYLISQRGPMLPSPPSLTAPPTADVTARLWALQLPDATGRPQALAQWHGQVLVANFWATWCPPCQKETPEFAKVSREYADKGVQFIGISIDPAKKIAAFAREFQIHYPLLVGEMAHMELSSELGNRARALPFTVILGRDGRVRHVRVGHLPKVELEEALRAVLDQP